MDKYDNCLIRMSVLLIWMCVGVPSIAQQDCEADEVEVIVEFITDSYPEENRWILSNIGGTVIFERDFSEDTLYNVTVTNALQNDTLFLEILTPELVGDTLRRGDTFVDTFCVHQDSCLQFQIFDAFQDGICCAFGIGAYNLYYDGELVRTGGDFTTQEKAIFGCGLGTDCSSAIEIVPGDYEADISVFDAWYYFKPESSGLYEISTCNSSCDTKLWVYEQCLGLVWDNNITGSIAFAVDGCEDNEDIALISLGMSSEREYYIRIGDDFDGCKNDTVQWTFGFLGEIEGCLDSLACNFDPSASIADTCLYPGSPDCPAGPDLIVYEERIKEEIYVVIEGEDDFSKFDCLIEEGCMTGYGERQLLKFNTRIGNIGDVDYYIGKTPPKQSDVSLPWEYAPCHNHIHYQGFAEYLLYDANNMPVNDATGKVGFCVEDSNCSGNLEKFTCGNQGISAHCYDEYPAENGSSQWDCQWVDVTDLEEGIYTLVVRANWNKAPDATGRVETNYYNNWAQVCINLAKNDTGKFEVTVVDECEPYIDCNGEIYGPAVVDCEGQCDGGALKGDISKNQMRDEVDVELYLNNILTNADMLNDCNDLNQDEKIDVSDLVLLTNCILQTDSVISTSDDWCVFPFSINNPNDTLVVSLGRLAQDSSFVELDMTIPTNGVLGFQFEMEGPSIDSVMYLGDKNLRVEEVDGHIIGLIVDNQEMEKITEYTPVLRVYYDTLNEMDTVCIKEVRGAMNSLRESIVMAIDTACRIVEIPVDTMPIDTTDTIIDAIEDIYRDFLSIYPNPFKEVTNFDFGEVQSKVSLIITDQTGKTLRREELTNVKNYQLKRKELSNGVYYYTIIAENFQKSGKLVIF